jgi:putative ABC transport system ATP-binding protein
MSSEPVAELTGVSKIYGTGDAAVTALAGVDLAVRPGEVVVVLGPSGSGKTTLLNVMGGIEPASTGRVRLGGRDLSSLNPEQLAAARRGTVGFVFQFFNLIATLTAAENIRIIAELVTEGRSQDIASEVAATLEAVDLADRADHFPGQLSGGQQQRAAIARALVAHPRLLLCDEPTGALDLESGRGVLALLQAQAVDGGRAVVVVTHNTGIATMANRVIRMHDGRVSSDTRQEPGPASEVTW